MAFLLRSDAPLSLVDGDAVASFRLGAGQSASFILEEARPGQPAVSSAPDYVSASFKRTSDFWRSVIARSTYRGRWREIVNRSVLTLSLLTSIEHGSMVASPTFGLPERLGGARNWDYRYPWIRDTSFALYAVQRLGFTNTRAFMEWVEARCGELRPDGSLQVMYGIDGRHELPEETLAHWSGYRHSQPVCIGNAAHGQLRGRGHLGGARRAPGIPPVQGHVLGGGRSGHPARAEALVSGTSTTSGTDTPPPLCRLRRPYSPAASAAGFGVGSPTFRSVFLSVWWNGSGRPGTWRTVSCS